MRGGEVPPRGNEGKSVDGFFFFLFFSFLFFSSLLLDKPSPPPFPFSSPRNPVKLVFSGESVLLDIITRFRG